MTKTDNPLLDSGKDFPHLQGRGGCTEENTWQRNHVHSWNKAFPAWKKLDGPSLQAGLSLRDPGSALTRKLIRWPTEWQLFLKY